MKEITFEMIDIPEEMRIKASRTPLEVRKGVVYDPKMTATRLKSCMKEEGIILLPDKDGDIRCYNGIIDLTELLRFFRYGSYTVYHQDELGIVIEYRGSE